MTNCNWKIKLKLYKNIKDKNLKEKKQGPNTKAKQIKG
jgi:hypothetical protein